MLKRVIVFLFLAATFLFGVYDKPLFEEYETALETVENSRAVIDDSPSIVIGSSGIILHTFENQESMIIARAIVISKVGKKATLEIVSFDSLAQNSFLSGFGIYIFAKNAAVISGCIHSISIKKSVIFLNDS